MREGRRGRREGSMVAWIEGEPIEENTERRRQAWEKGEPKKNLNKKKGGKRGGKE